MVQQEMDNGSVENHNPDEKDPRHHLDEETRKLLQVNLPDKNPNEMTGPELKADIDARKILAERKKQVYERMRTEVVAKMAGLAKSQAAIAKNEAALVAEKKRNASALEDIQKTNAREMLDCQAKSTMELLRGEDQKKRLQVANEEMKNMKMELAKAKDELSQTQQELHGWRASMKELENRESSILEQTRKLQARLDEVNAKTNRLRGNMRQALLIEKADPLSEQEDPSSVPEKDDQQLDIPIEKEPSSTPSSHPPPLSSTSSTPPYPLFSSLPPPRPISSSSSTSSTSPSPPLSSSPSSLSRPPSLTSSSSPSLPLSTSSSSSSSPPPPHSTSSSSSSFSTPPPHSSSSSSVIVTLGQKSSITSESGFEESEAINDAESYYEENLDEEYEEEYEDEEEIDDMDEDGQQELSTGEEVDDKEAMDVKETSESPSTTSSDCSDIEILNDDSIPMPPARPLMEPSPLLGEYEGCELYFCDLEGILDKGKMNDRLMDFSLATIWKNEAREEICDSTFVFPSLFYTRLIREARQSESEQAKETDTQRRERRERAVPENFRGVVGFTKGVDIFEKDYLLVPVVECDHWYLIVIVNPAALVINAQDTIQGRKKRSEKATLIILDSLPRTSDWRRDCVDRVLCLYLMFEHKRIHSDRPGRFEKTRMDVILPGSVPSQKNNVDCGFFVVRYAKTFLDRPPKDEMLLKKAPKWSDWFPRISTHPTQIRKDAEKRIKDEVDPTLWQKFEEFRAGPQMKAVDKVEAKEEDAEKTSSASTCESPAVKRRRLDTDDVSPARASLTLHALSPVVGQTRECGSRGETASPADTDTAPSTPATPARYSLDATDIRKMKARDVGKWMAAITGDTAMEERCVQANLRGAIVAKMDEQTLRSSLQLPEEMFAKVWADISRKP